MVHELSTGWDGPNPHGFEDEKEGTDGFQNDLSGGPQNPARRSRLDGLGFVAKDRREPFEEGPFRPLIGFGSDVAGQVGAFEVFELFEERFLASPR